MVTIRVLNLLLSPLSVILLVSILQYYNVLIFIKSFYPKVTRKEEVNCTEGGKMLNFGTDTNIL